MRSSIKPFDINTTKVSPRKIADFVQQIKPYLGDFTPDETAELFKILSALYELIMNNISSGSGDVVATTSSTNNNIVIYNGTTGKEIKDSTKKVADLETTFEVLSANGDVGTGADQVAAGNHEHSNYLIADGHEGIVEVLGSLGVICLHFNAGKLIDVTT